MPARSHNQPIRHAILLSAAALTAACSTSHPEAGPADHTSAPPAPTVSSSTPTSTQTATSAQPPTNSPTLIAQRWLAAYRTATWTEAPTHWIDSVRPYVTDAMHTRNNALHDGPVGTDWTTFVHNQCASTVSNLAAVIPPESPGTSTTANVQVTGTVTTTCTAGTPTSPRESTAATLVLTRDDGTWRVDQRLF